MYLLLSKSGYSGDVKTAFPHIVTAAAINFVYMGNWLIEKSLAKTRISAFERGMKQCACC
jgi:hypothetical protein